jgi:hypothetical protein
MNKLRFIFRKRGPTRPGYQPALVELESRLLLAVNVLTYHNDNSRTGENLAETILTPANVNSADFGKLFTDPVDGVVYAQPLYMAGVAVPGQGTHNLILVATEHDSVYAFDADSAGAPLWHDSFIDPNAGVTTVSDSDLKSNSISPEVGITGTPVIDPATNTLFVIAFTKEVSGTTTTYVQRLHALDVATGAEKFGGPVVIQASVPGSGQGSSSGVVSFDAFHENQRPGLLLDNGVVWITWASFDDHTPYHGWVIGYNAQTLQQVAVFNTTPDGGLGGIWQSGGGPAADAAGDMYVITGNGTFDASSATAPNQDYGDSFIKLANGAGGLTATGYFTPFNQATLDARDEDLGSGGPLLLPDQPGAHPHLLVSAGKEGKVYLLDRDNLGGFDPSVDHVVQEIPQAVTSLFGDPAYWNGFVYFAGTGDTLKAFQLSGGSLSSSPVSQTSTVFGYPGATPSISANGNTNGIVWAVQRGSQAVLRAYSATDLTTELYDSNQANGRDQFGSAVKFAAPTIANGEVFVSTQTGLTVFGLLQPSPPPGSISGQVFNDQNSNGRQDADEAGLSGWTVYLDLNGNGQLDSGEPSTTTDAAGTYQFTGLSPGTYQVREVPQSGWAQTTVNPPAVVITASAGVQDVNFGDTAQYGRAGTFIAQVYQDLLGRAADPGGLAYWSGQLNQGALTRSQVALAIENSLEYQTAEVEGVYSRYLHRTADPGGLAGWTAFLQAGGTLQQLEAQIAGSGEYFQVRGGGTNDGFLDALYQDALGRSVDTDGRTGWDGALANGTTPAQVAAAVLASPEFLQDLVQGLYQQFLHRTADTAGLNSWVANLEQGMSDNQVIAAFLGAEEYSNRL